jgi:hypothetical protein
MGKPETTLTQYDARILSQNNKARERNKRDTNRKAEVKLFLFADYMILYLKDTEHSTKKTLRSDKHF